MFHSILNKINNGVAFEASKTTEAKVTWKKKRKNSHSIGLNSENYVIPSICHSITQTLKNNFDRK